MHSDTNMNWITYNHCIAGHGSGANMWMNVLVVCYSCLGVPRARFKDWEVRL